MFLLESTWLALAVWLNEYGTLLGAVALTGLHGHRDLRRAPVGA